MINNTNKSITLVTGDDLDKKIRESMITVHDYFVNHHGFASKLHSGDRHKSSQIALRKIFLNPRNLKFCEKFIDDATMISHIDDESQSSCKKISIFTKKYLWEKLDERYFGALKTAVRLFLVDLWHRNAVLLSCYFNPKITTHNKFIESRVKPVFKHFESSKYREVRNHWRRFALMLDWKNESDIDLNDLWTISTFKHNNNIYSNLPVSAFIKHISEVYPNHASQGDVSLVNSYAKYIYGMPRDFSGVSYENYKGLKRQNPTKKDILESGLKTISTSVNELKVGPYEYFMALKSRTRSPKNLDWVFDCSFYVGLEHINHASISEHWVTYLAGFMAFSAKKNVNIKEKRSGIYLFCDYLFGYLPIWFEMNDKTELSYPLRPQDFIREVFWSNSFYGDNEKLPQDLSTLAMSRKSRPLFSAFLRTMHDFFEYCGVVDNNRNYSPISIALDSIGSGSRRLKTNKKPIAKSVFPFVSAFVSAIEDIGEKLQKIALTTSYFEIISASRRDLILSDYGISHSLMLNGIEYNFDKIPMKLFQWHRGKYGKGDSSRMTYMPTLSVIRMLKIALHSGLRLQNIQWLDIFTFDNFRKIDNELYFTPILVNTDKSLTQRFCYFNPQAMSSALKEKDFQINISNEPYKKVPYENNKRNSIYDPISALFRSPFNKEKSHPFSDGIYLSVWTKIQVLMSDIYNKKYNNNEVYNFHCISGVKEENNESEFKESVHRNLFSDGPVDSPYCPVKVQAIHTPHSLRATYITLRREFEVDPLIQSQVGHANLAQTNYYTVDEQLMLKLEKADRDLLDGSSNRITDFDRSLGIKPSKEGSGLKKAVFENREASIKDNFMIAVSMFGDTDETFSRFKSASYENLGVFDTNICVMGSNCSPEIVKEIGHKYKCSLCPLAIFSIDNLPAIAARRRKILADISKIEELSECQSSLEDSEINIEITSSNLNLLRLENAAFQAIETTLGFELANRQKNGFQFISRQPEIVKRKLKSVLLTSEQETLLARLSDGLNYPELIDTDFLVKLKRAVRSGKIPALSDINENYYSAICSKIATIMRLNNLNMRDLAKNMSELGIDLSELGHIGI